MADDALKRLEKLMKPPKICIITGVPGSGRYEVAKMLCDVYPGKISIPGYITTNPTPQQNLSITSVGIQELEERKLFTCWHSGGHHIYAVEFSEVEKILMLRQNPLLVLDLYPALDIYTRLATQNIDVVLIVLSPVGLSELDSIEGHKKVITILRDRLTLKHKKDKDFVETIINVARAHLLQGITGYGRMVINADGQAEQAAKEIAKLLGLEP